MHAAAQAINSNSALGHNYLGAMHGDRLRMNDPNPGAAKEAHRREAMRLGHAVEDWLKPDHFADQYRKMFGGDVQCWNTARRGQNVGPTAKAGDFLVERAGNRPLLFPLDFYAAGARPDFRIGLGDGTEAVFDFTTAAQAGHLLEKGDRFVLKQANVAYACEIVTPEWDRRHPELAQALHELDPAGNPPPKDIPPR